MKTFARWTLSDFGTHIFWLTFLSPCMSKIKNLALCAYDIPILDTLTQSSDPYLRLELYPRYLFPLSQFPAQTSETRKQTLQVRYKF
jgi:hypothetical protein